MDSSASILAVAIDHHPADHRLFSHAAYARSMTALNDDELMQLVGEGDRNAFGLLVKRHVDRCVAIAQRSLAGTLGDAEDVAQEAMMRLWRHAPRWEAGRAQVSTWLYRVVVNLCIDQTRKNKRYGGEVSDDLVDETPDAFDQMASQDVSKAVREAIQELPERQRTALVLCFYEGLSNADAAAVMELSVGAVEQLLVRARRSLRVSLADLRE